MTVSTSALRARLDWFLGPCCREPLYAPPNFTSSPWIVRSCPTSMNAVRCRRGAIYRPTVGPNDISIEGGGEIRVLIRASRSSQLKPWTLRAPRISDEPHSNASGSGSNRVAVPLRRYRAGSRGSALARSNCSAGYNEGTIMRADPPAGRRYSRLVRASAGATSRRIRDSMLAIGLGSTMAFAGGRVEIMAMSSSFTGSADGR